MNQNIEIGFHAFASGRSEEFGAVRSVSPDRRRLTVYVENAGDFEVPVEAVTAVGSQKVTFDCGKLDPDLRDAIAHAHDAEIAHDDAIEDRDEIGARDEIEERDEIGAREGGEAMREDMRDEIGAATLDRE